MEVAGLELLKKGRRLVELGRRLAAAEPDFQPGGFDLAGELDRLETVLADHGGRLVLGLLGGTGVGKSTLVSALAGAPISSASAIRPTTDRPVIYRHRDFPALDRFPAEVVTHEAEALRHVAIIDFPDFDSLVAGHHQTVLNRLEQLDLVLWVTDYHKYADRRLYQMIGRAGHLNAGSQAALLNKVDELEQRPEGSAATAEVLAAFDQALRREAGWRGPPPWPVSAWLGAMGRGGDGLGPLRDFLKDLREAKVRRSILNGNLEARYARLARGLAAAARPEKWLENLERLEELRRNYRPGAVIKGEMATLERELPGLTARRLAGLKQACAGPLRLLTDAWDFIAGHFQARPSGFGEPPRLAAPAFARHLAGHLEDLRSLTPIPEADETDLAAATETLFAEALDKHSRPRPWAGNWPLWLWPLVLAWLLIWAEGRGGAGLAALTAAAVRSAAPWLIFSVLGDVIIARFIWFRARRRLESQAAAALAEGASGLERLAETTFTVPLERAAAQRRTWLDLLGGIIDTEKDLV